MGVAAIALTGLIQRPTFSKGTLTPLPLRRPVTVGGTSWRRRRKVVVPNKNNKNQAKKKSIVDTEFDLVIVPADGVSLSGSDSDTVSDWSVGWFEPHHASFTTDNELEDDSFAVLVPCYGKSPFKAEDPQQQPPWAAALANLSKQENKRHLENWLACL